METHPFIQYWNATHKEDAVAFTCGRAFEFPGFPDPLMSPVFLSEVTSRAVSGLPGHHFNCVGDQAELSAKAEALGFRCVKKFKIAVTNPKPTPSGPFELLKLTDAVTQDWFWEILAEGFPKDLPFLRRLLPALAPKNFHTIVISDDHGPTALMNLGITGPQALVMTAAVRVRARRQGLSHALVKAAHAVLLEAEVTEALFWTEHDFLTPNGGQLSDYMIFSRA